MTPPEPPAIPRTIHMALDVGDVRIGVAVSRSGVIAEPLATIERRGRRQVLDDIGRIIAEHRISHCVLGLPRLEGGTEGEQAAKTRAFARSLARRFPTLEIDFWDERFTSNEARSLAGKRIAGKSNPGLVDRIAAAIILQEYLDHRSENRRDIQKED